MESNQPTKLTPEAQESMLSTMPPKKGGKGWMIVAIIATLVIIGLLIYGFLSMRSANNKAKEQADKISSLESQNSEQAQKVSELEAAATAKSTVPSTAISDREMISAALKAECSTHNTNVGPDIQSFTIKTISGNYAQASILCKGANEGPEVVLVKAGGNWNIVAVGIGEDIVPAKVRTLYSIPATIGKP